MTRILHREVTVDQHTHSSPSRHPAALDHPALIAQCQIRHGRGSGPGGQHRNKVQTAVRVCHRPTGLVGVGQERRSQAQNLRVAVFRLRVNLALKVRCAVDSRYQASERWRSRCSAGRIRINPDHHDFPAILAEAMDVIAARGMEVAEAAGSLGCSTSQLIKLLRAEPRALMWLNDYRQSVGKHALG